MFLKMPFLAFGIHNGGIAVDSALQQRILNNPFAYKLLEYQIDQQSFSELCQALRELAQMWEKQSLIEKAIVFYLYETVSIMRNKLLEYQQQNQKEKANLLEDMFIELDRLIMEECLQSGRYD